MSQSRQQGALRPKLIAVSVAACFAFSSPQIFANPTGANVVSGSALFAGAGNALTITNSANAIINWHGFSIGINEITRFIQPSALSAVLNRVVGSGGAVPQSVIDGILSSNGRVYLINPSGIVVGAGATIDVSGLVMSSLSLSDQDFLSGRLRFTEVPGAGAVVNNGVIQTTAGGNVYLIAPTVENNGLVRSPQGEIVLAAGKSVELVSDSSPYVTVRVTANTEQAVNVGSLIADSGRIGVYGALVRNAGVAEANGAVVGAGGQIRFVATKDLNIEAGSRISANGGAGGNVVLQAEGGTNLIAGTVEATGSSGKGGSVQALGVRVGVIGHGVIDASGETGGGTVLVGGDYQGKNPDVQNAERSFIGSDGVIRADARTTGDGGRVIVWADGDTRFYGSISARGGSRSGDGGFVETSGKHGLDFRGLVDTRAPLGQAGTLLLDPDTVTLTHGTSDSNIQCNGTSSCPGTAPFTDTAGDFAYGTLSDGTLNTQLNTGNVVVQSSSSDILIDASGVAIAPTGGANAQTLTLSAYGSVGWSGNWSYTNNGVLTLLANNSIFNNAGKLTAGSVILSAVNGIGAGSAIQTQVNNLQATNNGATGTIAVQNTGNLTLTDLGAGYAVLNVVGNVSINATGNIVVNSAVTAGRGIHLRADGDLALNANLTAHTTNSGLESNFVADADANGTGSITGAGNITSNGSDLFLSGVGVSIGSLNTTGPGSNSSNGNIQVNSTTGDISTGSITTRSIDARNAYGGSVSLQTATGRIIVNGNIDTRGANGVVDAGQMRYYGGTKGGDVRLLRTTIDSFAGTAVQVNGSILTSGGNAITSFDGYGGSGGDSGKVQIGGTVLSGPPVTVTMLSGAVTIGGIDTSGGNGAPTTTTVGCCFGSTSGGNGGSVTISATGLVSVPSITTIGGNAGSTAYPFVSTNGGIGGVVSIQAGSVNAGPIRTGGGAGGDGGEGFNSVGGSGGRSFVNAAGAVQIASIDTTGGRGGNGGAASFIATGGDGGDGGSVTVYGSSIMTGAVNVSGGPGGAAGSASNASGGFGGSAGRVSYYGGAGGITITGALLGRGGMGGVGGSVTDGNTYSDGGGGGSGANVSLTGPLISSVLFSTGPVSTGMIDVSGGNGANGGPVGTSFNNAWNGGDAGAVTIKGTTVTVNGTILARGGDAGIVVDTRFLFIPDPSVTPTAFPGGKGGKVDIGSSGEVKINQGATPFPGLVAIDTRGGAGGRGGDAHNSPASPAGPGGDGGNGGDVIVVGTPNITLIGSINTSGGAGGAGGAGAPPIPGGPGGQGGLGGDITLHAAEGSGIIFVFAGTTFTLSAGAGGAGGVPGGLAGMTAFDLRDKHFGPGNLDILGTVVIIDPLSDPALSSAVGRIGSCKA